MGQYIWLPGADLLVNPPRLIKAQLVGTTFVKFWCLVRIIFPKTDRADLKAPAFADRQTVTAVAG
ncbi:hypothetical protein RSK20926_06647 [Roseobacter sp. SK209-2-6]|nr:hypothetical protein RSK20926_06647 [Roseobacter sp. SK209-2-6]